MQTAKREVSRLLTRLPDNCSLEDIKAVVLYAAELVEEERVFKIGD